MTTLIVALISSTLFFLLGVMVGKEYAIREGLVTVRGNVEKQLPLPPSESREVAGGHTGKQQEKVDITFYDQLMKEGDQELNREIVEDEEKKPPPVSKAEKKTKTREKRESKPATEKHEAARPRRESGFSTGDYALQVAAFRDRSHAVQMVRILKREGFRAHLLRGVLPGGAGTFYRVWVGYYRNISDAVRARSRLLHLGSVKISKAMIIKR